VKSAQNRKLGYILLYTYNFYLSNFSKDAANSFNA